jgi:hypothetical protein
MEVRFEHHRLAGHVRFVEAVEADSDEVTRVLSGVERHDRAAVACLCSHISALRGFLDQTGSDVAGAIIMEDDVALHDDFVERIQSTMSNAPADTTLVALGYLVWRWPDIRWSGRDPSARDLATLHPSNVWGTHAYWISRNEAIRVVERLDRPLAQLAHGVTADAITQHSGGHIAYPPLVLEEAHDSTTDGEERLAAHRSAQLGFDVAAYSAAERAARATSIALCMIVKDEAAVIGRCLSSVRDLIDSWVICDTGSTDDTIDVIEAMLAGIPGRLHRREWRDFGHNRSELMALARETADHLLLLDADQTLHQAALLPALDLDGPDAYRLRHVGEVEYEVSRLVRGDLPWRFEGRTHEYLTCDRATRHELLTAWEIVHHADGGSRSDKFERDLVLLDAALEDRPDDPRTVFYLAQTLESLGRHERARELYLRRSELGGFEEEAWYAQWRAAALRNPNDPPGRLGELLSAWSRRPTRLEPLHDAVQLCAQQGWWDVAHALTSAGVRIDRPDDILFVHGRLYDDGLLADHRQVCAALGLGGHRARVDSSGEPTVEAPEPAGVSLTPTGLEQLAPSARFAQIVLDPAPDWPAFNPSIASGDELSMVVRTANYHRSSDGRYSVLHDPNGTMSAGPGVIRTHNFFVRLSPGLDVIDVRPIVDRSGRAEHPTMVRGLEDCRLVRWQGAWWMLATSRDSEPAGIARVVLGRLEESDDEVAVVEARQLDAPHPDVHEKNWVPWIRDGQLHIVYGWHPLRVFRLTAPTDAVHLEVDCVPNPAGASWRGSSQGVDVPGGVLFVVHEVSDALDGRRYLHRFVRLGVDGSLQVSALFTLTGSPIEFVAGMARRGDELVISFGVEDRLAALAVVALENVEAVLGQAVPFRQ